MRDHRSPERIIRSLVTGRLDEGGWELVGPNTWKHHAADLTRTVDEAGNTLIVNPLGDVVSLVEKKSDDKDKKGDKKKDADKDQKPSGDSKSKDKDDNDSDKPKDKTQDKDDPKKLKGGKTEVDLHPKTDDNPDSKKDKDVTEDALVELSTDKLKDYVNKTGGDRRRDPKYGINAVKKILARKKAGVSEEQIDELSKRTLSSYGKKAQAAAADKDTPSAKRAKHLKGSWMAGDKVSGAAKVNAKEETEITEISKGLAKRYIDKARDDQVQRHFPKDGKKDNHKIANRERGIRLAHDKLNKHSGKAQVNAKEEVQIDEISKELAGRYKKKAEKNLDKHETGAGNAAYSLDRQSERGVRTDRQNDQWNKTTNKLDYHERSIEKRHKGIKNANKRLNKEGFTPEELAHFDAVMAEEYVDMSKKTCDEIINAKGKPHRVYTATDETRHGIDLDQLKRHLGVKVDSDSVHKKFMHNLHTAGIRTGWSHSVGKHIAYHGPKI